MNAFHTSAFLGSLSALLLCGAFAEPAQAQSRDYEAVARLRAELASQAMSKSSGSRPVSGTGPIGMNYGDEPAFSHDGGPHVRVWYAQSGQHAVLPTDDDGNGIPDFVELLAERAETIAQAYDDAGWRRPLRDDTRGLPDDGGDDRFDVYLLDFGQGSDGVFVKEFCEGTPTVCGGFIAIENDFVGFGYVSIDDALRTLFSHEYAHAIAAAYFDGVPTWWNEGFATWAEFPYGAVENDVIRLTSRWFRTPSIALDDTTQPGSSWPYASSAFVMDLARRFGDGFPREVFERLSDASARSIPGALEAALEARSTTLEETWRSFAARGWFTGSRSRSPQDVWNAAQMPTYPVETVAFELPLRVDVPTWSVQALRLDAPSGRVQWAPCEGEEQASLVVVTSGAQQLIEADGTVVELSTSDTLLVVGRPRVSQGLCGQLVEAPDAPACPGGDACDPEPPVTPTPPGDDASKDEGCAAAGVSSISWAALGLLAFLRRRRRAATSA